MQDDPGGVTVIPLSSNQRSIDRTRSVLRAFAVLFAALLVFQVLFVGQLARLLVDPVGLTLLAILAFLLISSVWVVTRGWFGLPPAQVRIDNAGIGWFYPDGRKIEMKWDQPRLSVSIEDIFEKWDSGRTDLPSHHFWFNPPRGRAFLVDEESFNRLLDAARRRGVPISRDERRVPPSLVRVRYRIGVGRA